MGNNNSSSSSSNDGTERHGHGHSNGLGVLRRGNTGSLGLSRSELDKMCKPNGLYPSCTWDDRSIRRLIGDGKIAARLSGHETILNSGDRECPICFLHYSRSNVTSCCKANICTECYLQVRPMNGKNCLCPFCNTTNFTVKIDEKTEEKDMEKENELDDIELEKRRKKEIKEGEFGSRVLRERSESLTSSEKSEVDDQVIPFVMSPEERKKIEDLMREQYNHPLARRMDMEAEERREQHDQTYRRANSDRHIRNRGLLPRNFLSSRGGRNFNQIMRAFEQNYGEEGRPQTLDDLVVLEAAILLSMEQQAARRRNRGGSSEDGAASDQARPSFPHVLQALMARRAAESSRRGEDDDTEEEEENFIPRRIHRLRPGRRDRGFHLASEAGATAALLMRGVSEEEQMEMAIAASLRESQTQETESNEDDNNDQTEGANESTPAESETPAASSNADDA